MTSFHSFSYILLADAGPEVFTAATVVTCGLAGRTVVLKGGERAFYWRERNEKEERDDGNAENFHDRWHLRAWPPFHIHCLGHHPVVKTYPVCKIRIASQSSITNMYEPRIYIPGTR